MLAVWGVVASMGGGDGHIRAAGGGSGSRGSRLRRRRLICFADGDLRAGLADGPDGKPDNLHRQSDYVDGKGQRQERDHCDLVASAGLRSTDSEGHGHGDAGRQGETEHEHDRETGRAGHGWGIAMGSAHGSGYAGR